MPDLAHNFWNLIKFNETRARRRACRWHMAKYQCMHCVDPGCLRACPAPGAIVVAAQRHRRFQPRELHRLRLLHYGMSVRCAALEPEVQEGLQVHALFRSHRGRSGAGLHQGLPDPLPEFRRARRPARQSRTRAEQLRADGFQQAGVYNPPGVGGTNVIYVLAHADRPEAYGLPRDPHIPWSVWLWKGP